MKLEENLPKVEFFQAGNKGGDSLHLFILALDDTFHKSSYEVFKSFLDKNSQHKKWMIFSDYVFDDEKKEQDVATFSIMPYFEYFDTLDESIKSLSSKDLKSSKKVNPNFIEFINKSPILNLSFILSKKRKLCTDEKLYFITKLSLLVKQCKNRITNNDNIDYNKKLLKNYEFCLNEFSKKNQNLKLFRNIDIISQINAYIIFQIYSHLNDIELIGWFSDRDNMLGYKLNEFKTPLIFNLSNSQFHALASNLVDENYKVEVVYGLPDRSGDMYYDSLNRIPDLIAGAISSYNMKENSCTEKVLPVIEDILTNKEKNIIYKLDFTSEGFKAGVLDLQPNSGD